MGDNEHIVLQLCRGTFGPGVPSAAVMGNIAVETGFSFDYTQKQYGGGPGRGLFQMEKGMMASYNSFLAETKMTDSAASQIAFAQHELKHGTFIGAGNAKKIRDAFASGDVVEATTRFCELFERPGIPHLDKRIAAAKKYL